MKLLKYTPAVLAVLFLTACNPVEQAVNGVQDVADTAGQQVDNVIDAVDDTVDAAGDVMEKVGDAMVDGEDAMENDGDAMVDGEDAMENDGDVMVKDELGYTEFTSDVLTNGETKVVFFHADWCPACRANEKKIMDWLEAGMSFDNVVYKADYDSETAAKTALGVTSQDSFVVVDGEGNVVMGPEVFPSEEKLKELLNA